MRPLFVYGTLLFPEILHLLLGRLPVSSEAVLPGYHRFSIHDGPCVRAYPAVFPQPGAEVHGLLLHGLSPAEQAVLDAYEDDDYIKTAVTVVQKGEMTDANVYVWHTGKKGQLRGTWDAEQFRAQNLQTYIERMH
jgi:gamma-glutamylcyclotransferase (GGCT)/AIG2-like uncharacterized protein YtfP